ncbi:MAG: hypothetical protein ABWW65_02860 [Thermoprotei archaeon]
MENHLGNHHYRCWFLSVYAIFLTHPPETGQVVLSGEVIINIGDVKEAQEIAKKILDAYWSKVDELRVYAIEMFRSRKHIDNGFSKYDLNYTYEFQRFILK